MTPESSYRSISSTSYPSRLGTVTPDHPSRVVTGSSRPSRTARTRRIAPLKSTRMSRIGIGAKYAVS